jgi:hypothetical protein
MDRTVPQAISVGIYNHLLFIDIDAFREKLHASRTYPDSGRNIKAGLQEQDQDFSSEFWRLGLLRGKIVDDGTPYENLILKLYETKIELWSANPRYSLSSLDPGLRFIDT